MVTLFSSLPHEDSCFMELMALQPSSAQASICTSEICINWYKPTNENKITKQIFGLCD